MAVAALFLFSACGTAVPEDELARRVRASHPTWQSYSEDIKAQLGAGPAAEWEGSLREVRVEGDEIRVVVALSGPWAKRTVAAPVLLNDPVGGARQNTTAERDDSRVTYGFPLPASQAGLAVPWVELKFPNGQRRVTLTEAGTWAAPAGQTENPPE